MLLSTAARSSVLTCRLTEYVEQEDGHWEHQSDLEDVVDSRTDLACRHFDGSGDGVRHLQTIWA